MSPELRESLSNLLFKNCTLLKNVTVTCMHKIFALD